MIFFGCKPKSEVNIPHKPYLQIEYLNPINYYSHVTLDTIKGYYKDLKIVNHFDEDIELLFLDSSWAGKYATVEFPEDSIYIKEKLVTINNTHYSSEKKSWYISTHECCPADTISKLIMRDSSITVGNYLDQYDSVFVCIKVRRIKDNSFKILGALFNFDEQKEKVYKLTDEYSDPWH